MSVEAAFSEGKGRPCVMSRPQAMSGVSLWAFEICAAFSRGNTRQAGGEPGTGDQG